MRRSSTWVSLSGSSWHRTLLVTHVHTYTVVKSRFALGVHHYVFNVPVISPGFREPHGGNAAAAPAVWLVSLLGTAPVLCACGIPTCCFLRNFVITELSHTHRSRCLLNYRASVWSGSQIPILECCL